MAADGSDADKAAMMRAIQLSNDADGPEVEVIKEKLNDGEEFFVVTEKKTKK